MYIIIKKVSGDKYKVLHLMNKDVKFSWIGSLYSQKYSYSRNTSQRSYEGRTKPYRWKTWLGAENFCRRYFKTLSDEIGVPTVVIASSLDESKLTDYNKGELSPN